MDGTIELRFGDTLVGVLDGNHYPHLWLDLLRETRTHATAKSDPPTRARFGTASEREGARHHDGVPLRASTLADRFPTTDFVALSEVSLHPAWELRTVRAMLRKLVTMGGIERSGWGRWSRYRRVPPEGRGL